MARLSEQLERQAEDARRDLAFSLDELRGRMSPGQIIDEVTTYARETPVADFLGNMVRDIRENPLPLLLVAAGIAWTVISTTRSRTKSQAIIAAEPHPVEVWRPDPVAADRSWEVAAITPAAD